MEGHRNTREKADQVPPLPKDKKVIIKRNNKGSWERTNVGPSQKRSGSGEELQKGLGGKKEKRDKKRDIQGPKLKVR